MFEKERIMVGQDLDINFFRSEKETGKITFGESRGNLRKTDSGEKPNKCNLCGCEFSRAFGLRDGIGRMVILYRCDTKSIASERC